MLRDGLRRHPEMASGFVVRGWVLAEEGEIEGAVEAFRAALELDSENVAALRGLGDALLSQEQHREALDVFRRLRPLDPLDPGLPGQIQELDAAVEAGDAPPPEAQEPSTEKAARPRLWEDPERVAEELAWDSASLQADSSREIVPGEVVTPGEEELGEPGKDDLEVAAPPSFRGDALVTRTMGDIYLRQGLLDQAEEVFQDLLDRRPQDPELRAKLEEVRATRQGEISAEGAGPPREEREEQSAPVPVVPVEDLVPERIIPIEELAPDVIVPIGEVAPDLIVPIESLAPDSRSEDPRLRAFESWLDQLP